MNDRSRRRPFIPLVNADGDAITRRSALQWMAASLALANGACTKAPEAQLFSAVTMPEAGRGDVPAYYASAFVRDGHALGVLVGTREGRPIKIEGNPAHPSSLGGTDVFAQASILELWDPDRSQLVWQRASGTDVFAAEPAMTVSTWTAFEAAWRQRATDLDARRARGLAVLTPRFTSPTQGLQMQALLRRFPQARWHRHSPLAPRAAREGSRLAFGRELDTVLYLDRARCVVAFDADPFSDGPGLVRQAHDWASQRACTGVGERTRARDAPRSFAIESSPGLFGARADERVAMPPGQIERLVDEIDGLVGGSMKSAAPSPLARRLAAALEQAGAASLLVAGRHLSARTHAQIAVLHQRLGAWAHAIDAIEPLDGVEGLVPESLQALVEGIDAQRVDTVLIVGGNPAYDSPGAIAFAAALRRVPFSAHLSLDRNETSRLALWHLPASHDYESWGDARGHDGTASLLQPAILPLYDSRSPIEWLAFLGDGEHRAGKELVQATWRARQGLRRLADGSEDPRFVTWWRASLRAGLVEGSVAGPVTLPRALPIAAAAPAAAPPLVAVFTADPSLDGGRFANNGWLQELPRPLTKLTWDNALYLGPKTAAMHGLCTGDIARVDADGRSADAPVWVLSEQAEGVATLPLGHGRRAAGRVGNGVGFDAFALRGADDAPVAITLTRTGRSHRFAVTQHRLEQEGRALARSVIAGGAIAADPARPSLYPPIAYPGHAWAMTIDLDACIGCNACTIACQAENNIPVVGAEEVVRGRAMHWIRVDRYAAEAPAGGSIFQPVPCMHCENAPCEVVCPVGATVHDSEGLNLQVYNRCVGTRFCSNNCPYKVRRFNFLQYTDDSTDTLKAMRNPDVTVRQRGVMEKCTYCLQRITRARLAAETSGVALADGDVVTACQSACPTGAIHFGDLDDARSDIVRAKASPRHYAMLDELNTRPRTTYLARSIAAIGTEARDPE